MEVVSGATLIPYQHFPLGVSFILTMNAFQYVFNMLIKSRIIEEAFINDKLADYWMIHRGIHRIIHSILIFYGGLLADSYFGKYSVYLINIALETFVYIPFIIVITIVPKIQHSDIKLRYLITSDLIVPFIKFGFQLRNVIIAEQFILPDFVEHFVFYLYCDYWLRNLATIIALCALPFLTNVFGRISCYYIGVIHVIGFIVNCIYFLGLLKLANAIYIKKRISLIVEKVIFCTYGKMREKITGRVHVHKNFCNESIAANSKYLLNVLLFIACCAPYWAVRESVFISWLIQASYMNNHAWNLHVHPVIINALPCLINLIFLPIAYKWIYPPMRFRIIETSLKIFRFAYGLIACALICGAALGILIEQNAKTPTAKWGLGQLKIYNGLPHKVFLRIPWVSDEVSLRPYDLKMFFNIQTHNGEAMASAYIYNKYYNYTWYGGVHVYEHESISYVLKKSGLVRANKFDDVVVFAAARPRVLALCAENCGTGIITFYNKNTLMNFTKEIPNDNEQQSIELYGLGDYIVYINGKEMEKQHFESGEVRSLLIYMNENGQIKHKTYLIVQKHETSILFMIPQCIFLSLADIFSYVPFHFILYIASPPHLRGICYSINEMLIFIGDGCILFGDLFLSYHQLSALMTYLFLINFLFGLVYILTTIKIKLHFEVE